MSFGDHLDELRRRLLMSLAAMAVCLLGIVPFKETVTSIYLQPYRLMWHQGFSAYVDDVRERVPRLEAELAEAEGPAQESMEIALRIYREKVAWLDEYAPAILAGTYPFQDHADQIRLQGGFKLPYSLVATGAMEDFWTFMAASFLFALLIASPIVVWQMWAFVAAGLYRHERKAVLRNVPFAVLLLLAGVGFGYFVAVPWAFYFLVQLMNSGYVEPWFTVSQYFGLLFGLTVALGLVFQLPLAMLVVHRIGLVRHETLRKQWRYVVLGICVLAALVTPPDPFTMALTAGPMVGLYGLGLLLTAHAERRHPHLSGRPVEST